MENNKFSEYDNVGEKFLHSKKKFHKNYKFFENL